MADTQPDLDPDDLPDVSHLQATWERVLDRLLGSWTRLEDRQKADLVAAVRDLAEADDLDELGSLTVASTETAEALLDAMADIAAEAGEQVVEEAAAQGVELVAQAVASAILEAVAVVVAAVRAASLAGSAALAAMRAAGPTATPAEVAGAVDRHLASLSPDGPRPLLGGALTGAQNAARAETLRSGPVGALYASEQNDRNTCPPCKEVNGRWLGNTDEDRAWASYPLGAFGGYILCEGRERCRGTITGVWRPAPVGGGDREARRLSEELERDRRRQQEQADQDDAERRRQERRDAEEVERRLREQRELEEEERRAQERQEREEEERREREDRRKRGPEPPADGDLTPQPEAEAVRQAATRRRDDSDDAEALAANRVYCIEDEYLTGDAAEAAEAMEDFITLNEFLRSGGTKVDEEWGKTPEGMAVAVTAMDRSFDVLGITVTQPIRLRRFVDDGHPLGDAQPGDEFVEDGYMSTTTGGQALIDDGWGDIRMEIDVPAGAVVQAGSETQEELIFPRGTRVRVVRSRQGADGRRVLDLEVLPLPPEAVR